MTGQPLPNENEVFPHVPCEVHNYNHAQMHMSATDEALWDSELLNKRMYSLYNRPQMRAFMNDNVLSISPMIPIKCEICLLSLCMPSVCYEGKVGHIIDSSFSS